MQFASDTTETLAAAARLANSKRRLVNNLFGEGMSPKLRSLRLGLEALGLAPDEYLRHHSPRLLYAVPLVSNFEDILLGLTRKPKYILPMAGGTKTTGAIAEHWSERWLARRLDRAELLPNLRSTLRDDQLLSRISSDLSASSYASAHFEDGPIAEPVLHAQNSAGPIRFVERLYRNRNSYADKLSHDELEWIHIDMGLDEFIVDGAREGRQIIVTGNPGDGKTFLIQRLRAQLEAEYNAIVIPDANACRDAEVLSAWRSCDENKQPFILAINEWPLFELRRLARDEQFAPVEEAIRQVREAVFYGAAPDPPHGRVSVVDLNLRNVLADRVTLAAVDRLTADRFVSELDSADPASVNVQRLRSSRVQERLAALLQQAARRGEHTTMRQLMGFVAYLITGGTDATGRLRSQKDDRYLYANLAFDGGDGPLFDLVRRAFDPARVTYPSFDEDLWRGTTDPSDWLDPSDVPVAAAGLPEEDRERCFRSAKRRFYFEHAAGDRAARGPCPTTRRCSIACSQKAFKGTPNSCATSCSRSTASIEPDSKKDEDNRLTLWQSHRYDVQAPAAFVAMYHEPADGMAVEGPSVATWVSSWLATDLHRVSQFALRTSQHDGQHTRLLVDRELYLTLREAAVGLGRSTWSRSAARKVTRFVDELHRLFHEPKALSDLEMRNVDTDLRTKLQVRLAPAEVPAMSSIENPTSAAAPESPDTLLRRIYDEEFGFLPTNSSMKPVHVANALARRLTGTTTDHLPLARVIRQYTKKQTGGYMEERNPNSAILEAFPDRFQDSYGNPPSDERLTAFRSLAKETLGADGAAFEADQSSFTLSHVRMITTDLSDNGSGDLLAALLCAGQDHPGRTGAELLGTLMQEDADPWTMVGWPMLDVGTQKDAALSGAALTRSERVAPLLATDPNGVILSPMLRELRARYDQLAEYERTYGAKLTALRRMVLFGCFAIHVHMIRRCGEVLGLDGPRPPILLDLFDGQRRSLREASAATLQAGFRASSNWCCTASASTSARSPPKAGKSVSASISTASRRRRQRPDPRRVRGSAGRRQLGRRARRGLLEDRIWRRRPKIGQGLTVARAARARPPQRLSPALRRPRARRQGTQALWHQR